MRQPGPAADHVVRLPDGRRLTGKSFGPLDGPSGNIACMLELRPNCECCDRDLAPSDEAYICTFECTWCPGCVATFPGRACPNCGGDLQRRPVRPAAALERHPAGVRRVVSAGCRERFATP